MNQRTPIIFGLFVRVHALCLDATKEGAIADLHHHEVVTIALARLAEEMKGGGRSQTLDRMRRLRSDRPSGTSGQTVAP